MNNFTSDLRNNLNVLLSQNYIYIVVYMVISFLFLLLFSTSTSPLYIIEGSDSVVFKQMGAYILNGKVPYVDMFDHKGPLLYFIQALGQWINPNRWGIFLIQWLGLSVSTIMWYKISSMYLSPLKSFLSVLLVLFTYFYVIQGGNLTEDYSSIFISISFYSCLHILKLESTNKCKKVLYGLVGACLAAVFFIRPNDAVAFVGSLLLGVFVYYIVNKLYKDALNEVLFAGVGFLIITTPIISFFAYHDALNDLWYGLIEYNSLYSEGLIHMISDCLSVTKGAYIPILIAVAVLCYKQNDKKICVLIYPTLILAYVFLGSRLYLHYFIVWLPIIVLSFWIFVLQSKHLVIRVLAILVFLSLPIRSGNILKTPYHYYAFVKQGLSLSEKEKKLILHSQEIFANVSTEERDSIWSYNLAWNDTVMTFHMLYKNNILPCNNVQIPFMADVDKNLYKTNIATTLPKYILLSENEEKPVSFHLQDSLFINNNYHVLDTIMNPNIILYKRNE